MSDTVSLSLARAELDTSMPRIRGIPDIRRFRRRRVRAAFRPYEILFEDDRWSTATREAAEAVIAGWWTCGSFPAAAFVPPIDWSALGAEHRSWQFHLQAWAPLGPVLSAFDQTGEARFLDRALALAVDWAGRHEVVDDASPFAWNDMAVGIRAYRLAYLADVAAGAASVDDETVEILTEAVLAHRTVLAEEGRFPAHSNHGFYFAAGQAALAARFPELPGMDDAAVQARERLRRLLASQFTPEGVHREHSPEYHWMVLETLEGLRQAGLLDGLDHEAERSRREEALAWFVLPNGRLAMLGDSSHRQMVTADPPRVGNDALRFVLSGGREGLPPETDVRGFPASGYVVFRSGWPEGPDDLTDWSYLAQACAFHSRTHKHADDLAFIWYDRGREILVDPGGHSYGGRTEPGSRLWEDGFWYSDPDRIYVESTRAHNTVEVDGRNFPRRGVRPYGSALTRWGERSGVHYAESELRHWETICHRRVLLFRPGDWLVVYDWLWDEETAPHRFVQRFHFAPELDVAPDGEAGFVVTLPGEDQPLRVVPLLPAERVAPVRGQREPERLGWIARERGAMVPCSTAGYASAGRPGHTFATLFTFGDDAPRPVAGEPLGEDGEYGVRLRWIRDRQVHTVAFSRPAPGAFRFDHRIALEETRRDRDQPGGR